MSEKGDLPQDTDSLPPNYATSEVFTDSPPPAYRKTSTVRLQITRVVCLTILVAGFLTGVFILSHSWINRNSECHSDKAPNAPIQDARYLGASSFPHVQSLVASSPTEDETEMNAIDSSDLEKESRQMDIPLDEEIIVEDEPIELSEPAVEEEQQENMQEIVEEIQNQANLPLDLIMGNPQLAGKNANCKVEKKLQDLGGGIMSKTILVTCDDENDDSEGPKNPFGGLMSSRPPVAPPMSLLAPILKMMAARATARLQRQLKPKPALRTFRQPLALNGMPFGKTFNGPLPMNGPTPFNGPPHFHGPPPHFHGPPHPHGPGHFNGPVPFNGPSPFNGPMHHDGPVPFDGPPPHFHHRPMMNQGPMSREMNGPRHFPFPGNSIGDMNGPHHPFMHNEPQMPLNEPMGPFHGDLPTFDNEPETPFREDFVENRPPMPEPRPQPMIRMISAQPLNVDQGPKEESPIKIIQGFPPQMPNALKQIVSQIMNRANNDDMIGQPIIKIKTFSEDDGDMPRNKMVFPMPMRAVKVQGREARKLHHEENSFPHPGMTPHVVPEAAPRALDSPVALPSVSELSPFRFYPGQLRHIAIPIQGRAITHMEMKQNPNLIDNEPQIIEEESVNENFPVMEGEEGPDFGPPRFHTLIDSPQEDNLQEETNPLPPFISRFPPPPPRFAREGRVGTITEINSDAELVKPVVAEANTHRMIMVN